MPGQQNTILFEMKGAAAGALGADSPSGVNTDAAVGGTNKESSSFYKKMKNVPKQIASFSKSSLGVQFSLAAMLRQSQIATGFLSAMFQVLGAIVDSFLVAFAPTLFSAIAGMAKLIPVARATGFAIVASVNSVRERIWEFMNWILPILKWIGKSILGIVKFVMGLPKIVLGLGLVGLLLGKLIAHFKVKHYTVMYNINFRSTLKALTVWRARSPKGGASGGGLLGAVGGINPIVGIVMAVAVVAAPLIMGFLGRDKGSSSQGVDVSGQLGKKYLPSQASKLGTDLNKLMSELNPTFAVVNEAAAGVGEALVSMATDIGGEVDAVVLKYLEHQEAMSEQDKVIQNMTKGILENTTELTNEFVGMATDLKTGVVDKAVNDYLLQQDAMSGAEKSINKVTAALIAMNAGMTISKTPTEIKKDKVDRTLIDQLSNFGGGGGSGTSPFVEALNSAKETANLNRDIVGQLSMFSEGMSYLNTEKAKDPVVRRIDQGIQSQLSMYQESTALDRSRLRIAEQEAEERKREHQENLSLGRSMAAALGNIGNF